MLPLIAGLVGGALVGGVLLRRQLVRRYTEAGRRAAAMVAMTQDDSREVAIALDALGFSRAGLAFGSDRANRYFAVPIDELGRIGQSAARRVVEPLFPGAKAEFVDDARAPYTSIPLPGR